MKDIKKTLEEHKDWVESSDAKYTLRFNFKKKRINLTIDPSILKWARKNRINLSRTLEETLARFIKKDSKR